MRHYFNILTVLLLVLITSCGTSTSDANQEEYKTYLIRPHQEDIEATLPSEGNTCSIFLAGTIDMGTARDWQSEIAQMVKDSTQNLVFYTPRQEHWDASRPGEMDYQVNWELSHLEKADVIIMYIIGTSKSPISLLEMGLFARSKKMVVICEPDFYRYDNVRITCEFYDIPLYTSLASIFS